MVKIESTMDLIKANTNTAKIENQIIRVHRL